MHGIYSRRANEQWCDNFWSVDDTLTISIISLASQRVTVCFAHNVSIWKKKKQIFQTKTLFSMRFACNQYCRTRLILFR